MAALSFSLPITVVAGGLLSLAGIIYALHILRTRYKTVVLPSNIFWQRAIKKAPAKIFRRRFSHILAAILCFVICGLLWLGFSEPNYKAPNNAGYTIFYLDASAPMQTADFFARAVKALQEDLSAIHPSQREVVWGGAFTHRLLGPGESAQLLEKRLAKLKPDMAPNHFSRYLRLLQHRHSKEQTIALRVYGLAGLNIKAPAAIRLSHEVPLSTSAPNNKGIVSLGWADTEHNEFAVDVLLKLHDPENTLSSKLLNIQINGEPYAGTIEKPAPHTFILKSLPAKGQTLAVSLPPADAFSADDTAQLILPQKQAIKVAISESIPNTIFAVVNADKGIQVVPVNQAQLTVRLASENFGMHLPSLQLVEQKDQNAVSVFGYPHYSETAPPLLGFRALGIENLLTKGLTADFSSVPRVTFEAQQPATIRVWQTLFTHSSGFSRTAAFPEFIARSLRHLAQTAEAIAPFAQAGEYLPLQNAAYSWGASPEIAGLDGKIYLPQAGKLPVANTSVAASLINTAISSTKPEVNTEKNPATALPEFNNLPLLPALPLLVIALLLLEWRLYQLGRIP